MAKKSTKFLSLALLSTALYGCAGAPVNVASGDRVELGFSCRLPNGELAATTRTDSAVGAERKSPFYLPRTGSETVILTAGVQPEAPGQDRLPFEAEIMKRLAPSLVGLSVGTSTVVDLRAERYPAATPTERFVRMATVRKRQKEMRLTREEYTTRSGKDPAVGQRLVIDPLVPGKVSEVTGQEVVVQFAPVEKTPLTIPFGPITVRETPSHYELEIRAEQGRLVRTGGMAGQISAVDNDSFQIDYGHPFGNEMLRCDVNVVAVEPAVKNTVTTYGIKTHVTPVAAGNEKLDPEAEKVFAAGMAKAAAMSARATGGAPAARSGDLVTTDYTVTLADGTLVATTRESVARDQAVQKVLWYQEPSLHAPVELVAGTAAVVPGLGEALVGMSSGEKRRITVTPDQAFGMPDPQKRQQLSCSQTFPKTVRLPTDEFVKRFSAQPTLQSEVELLPYFKSRVIEITGRDVALEFQVTDGATFSDSFGSVSITVAGDSITSTLKPLVGAPFPLKDGFGIISATDGATFTVDFNHPLAGKTIVLELEAVAVAASVPGESRAVLN